MLTIGDNTNYSPNSITVTGNPSWIYMPYPEQFFQTTDGNSPVSNALAETYANIIFPYQIVKVIFHDPATIVIWKDKTKTVVKRHNEPYDREKGLAMCIAKKVLGEKFHKTLREWCFNKELKKTMTKCFKCGKILPGTLRPGEYVMCKECEEKWSSVKSTIDKDALEGMVNELMKLKPFGWVFVPRMEDATTIKAEEKDIVLCRDCKHYFMDNDGSVITYKCELNHESMRSYFFCADGEKEGEEQ